MTSTYSHIHTHTLHNMSMSVTMAPVEQLLLFVLAPVEQKFPIFGCFSNVLGNIATSHHKYSKVADYFGDIFMTV